MRATRMRQRWLFSGGVVIAVLGLLASFAGGTPPAAASTATASTRWAAPAEIDALVKAERARLKLSGLSVVVLAHGSIVFDRSYGDAAPGGPVVTENTPFVLGSTSKQLTGLAVQQLIAQGRLSLTDTVGVLLRPLGGATSPFADVTVAELLSHRSGISTNAGTADVFDPLPGFSSIRAESRHLLTVAPSSKPGTAFEYSNGNYTLLGSIIEQVTGNSFENSLQTLVAQPLGLRMTTSDLALAQTNGLAVGHYSWLGMIDSTTPGPRWPIGAPSAYTASTASDLTRLLRAELGQSSGIDPAVFAADHAPLTTVNRYTKYASGWYIRKFWELHNQDQNYDDPKLPLIYEHDGDTSRETSYLAFSPKLGFGVVVLSNTGLGTDTGRFDDFTYHLLHTIVGTKATPRAVDPLISATPLLMVALPLLQLAVLIALAVSILRPRRGWLGRWIPRIAAPLVTVATLLIALVLVPEQTHQPLLAHGWWAAVPDLAVSVGVSLVFAAACFAIAIAVTLRRTVFKRDRSRPVQLGQAAQTF